MSAKHFLWVAVLLAAPSVSLAADHTVPGMHANIQDAVDMAVSGDRILLAPGTYFGPGNVNVDFQGKALTIESATGNRDAVIDSQGADVAFTIADGSQLKGLIVKNAGLVCNYVDWPNVALVDCGFTDDRNVIEWGASVYAYIDRCTFENSSVGCFENSVISNSTFLGAAINVDSPADWSTSYIVGCTFGSGSLIDVEMSSSDVWGCNFSGGSGIYAYWPQLSVWSCIFDESRIDAYGYDLYPNEMGLWIDDCTFTNGNSGISADNLGTGIDGCVFRTCSGVDATYDSTYFQDAYLGLGVYGSAFVHSGIGADGQSDYGGTAADVRHCTITAGGSVSGTNLNVDYCILWDGYLYGSTANHSDIGTGPRRGVGNIHADPRFIRNPSPGADNTWGTPDDNFGDLHLRPGSPAVGMGAYDVAAVVPAMSALTPALCTAGAAPVITATGDFFVKGAKVLFNGVARPATYISDAKLRFALSAADTAVGGIYDVVVVNPDGATSNTLPFTVNNRAPVVTALYPPGVPKGSPSFLLEVAGKYFVPTSVILWDGVALPTLLNTTTGELSAMVPASYVAVAGAHAVQVANPAPGGGTSNTRSFRALK